MAKITIGLGLVLIALGLGGYFSTGRESPTALIPVLFGLPLLILGWVALKEHMPDTRCMLPASSLCWVLRGPSAD